ncbi:hypothetical protein P2318_00340 [Myxococcaceae bacterium GXIMD 01537]
MGLRELKESAHAQYLRGRFEQCAQTYLQILRLAPKDPNMRVRHAEACRRAGARQKAIASYRTAADLLLALGCESRARGALKAALELDPKDPELLADLARLGHSGPSVPTALEDERLYSAAMVPGVLEPWEPSMGVRSQTSAGLMAARAPSSAGVPALPARRSTSMGLPALPPRRSTSAGLPAMPLRSGTSAGLSAVSPGVLGGVSAMPPRSMSSTVLPAMPPRSMSSTALPAVAPRSMSSAALPVVAPRSMSSAALPAMSPRGGTSAGMQAMPSRSGTSAGLAASHGRSAAPTIPPLAPLGSESPPRRALASHVITPPPPPRAAFLEEVPTPKRVVAPPMLAQTPPPFRPSAREAVEPSRPVAAQAAPVGQRAAPPSPGAPPAPSAEQGVRLQAEVRRLAPHAIAFRLSPRSRWVVFTSRMPIQVRRVDALEELPADELHDFTLDITVEFPEADSGADLLT